MSEPRRGLGRGLSALLGDAEAPAQAGVKVVPIERLRPGRFQPRRHFDETALEALAQSIATQGVLQPLLVRPSGDDYEIIAGERRWRAAQRARLHEVPVVVREVGDRDALEFALVENVQREDLGALEEGAGYQRLIAEFGYTQDDLAQRVGKSRSHVANTIRLLALPPEVRALVEGGQLSAGHARALLTAKDPVALAREVVRWGMSVRQVESAAKRTLDDEGTARPRAKTPRDPNVAAAEKDLAIILGMRVKIEGDPAGAGTLAIDYRTLDQLDDLVARLKTAPPAKANRADR